MQTPFPTKASARACTAPQQHSFRLPLASCRYNHHGGGMEAKSADGSYSLHLVPAHGVQWVKTQFWALEQRQDELGRQWTCTTAEFAVDDFGDLVEVAS